MERRQSPVDRRVNSVWLTERGEGVMRELVAHAEEEEATLAAGMSPDERAELVRLLGQVVQNLA